ncbi:hypothetical protein [Pseudonocardia humida]|uniref:Uncharacterized protein n=1 Tax=Pseudonocardia humida TaxID=2800819 RepID=A0ABT1ACH8_9PSEU|nr:hypothetical protein [Pseudonocardia humida]MCO1660767.1 hypothetical protein [Pseudonocardia humida]
MTVPKPGPPTSAPARPADPRQTVERAVAALDGLADRPLAEHVEVFERVHAALGEALASPAGTA